jgi:hypothetical protein
VTGLDSLAYRLRPADGTPEGALVLFHGRGAAEASLTMPTKEVGAALPARPSKPGPK